ncbi:MAG: AmmeMemoRadiSam system radical SAM enzyme [Candidatus Omnitrophota bacterium]|jgi:pyruvate formate lyase activating enzyme
MSHKRAMPVCGKISMKHQAMFFKKYNNYVQCYLCAHNCRIIPGGFGICKVRKNIDGELFTFAYGMAAAAHVDPIEKKPLYHFLPKTKTFSIAAAGCNFRCRFCQNWQISQQTAENGGTSSRLMPDDIVQAAIRSGCASISYTYTEPTVFFEYSYDTARLARQKGLRNVYVTNGYMGKEALDTIGPYLDAANIDLKSFNDGFYRDICKGRLKPVLKTIERMWSKGIWIEITTLLIAGENDSSGELRDIARFIADIDKNIPWHISRFHPDHKMLNADITPMALMEKAGEIGAGAGLKNVYLGNIK